MKIQQKGSVLAKFGTNVKVGLVMGAVVVLTLVGAVVYWKQGEVENNQMGVEKQVAEELELPEGFAWKVVPQGSEQINYVVWREVNKGERGLIRLPGREWVDEQVVNTEKELYRKSAYDLLKKTLTTEEGWRETFSSADLNFSNVGWETDLLKLYGITRSPTTEGSTFMRKTESGFEVVSLREYSDKKYIISGRGSVDYKYPHIKEFRLFISDPVTETRVYELKGKPQTESEWFLE